MGSLNELRLTLSILSLNDDGSVYRMGARPFVGFRLLRTTPYRIVRAAAGRTLRHRATTWDIVCIVFPCRLVMARDDDVPPRSCSAM
jgi:hypothetical protein